MTTKKEDSFDTFPFAVIGVMFIISLISIGTMFIVDYNEPERVRCVKVAKRGCSNVDESGDFGACIAKACGEAK